MLKGISPLVSPELLSVLCRMGHGDEIVLADAHFPGETVGQRVLRADGLKIPELLDAILPLLELDSYVDSPVIMMAAVPGDQLLMMSVFHQLTVIEHEDAVCTSGGGETVGDGDARPAGGQMTERPRDAHLCQRVDR